MSPTPSSIPSSAGSAQHRNLSTVDRRPWQRAASCHDQALLVLRCLKDATLIDAAARDIAVSRATGYRYFHEAIDVIAEHAPDLADVLERAEVEGWSHIELDGTLIPTTRVSIRTERGNDAWYSRQAQAARREPAGPLRPARVPGLGLPGRARIDPRHHRRAPARVPGPEPRRRDLAAGPGRPRLPRRRHRLPPRDQQAEPRRGDEGENRFLTGLRCICERGNALLKAGWRCLRAPGTRSCVLLSAVM